MVEAIVVGSRVSQLVLVQLGDRIVAIKDTNATVRQGYLQLVNIGIERCELRAIVSQFLQHLVLFVF